MEFRQKMTPAPLCRNCITSGGECCTIWYRCIQTDNTLIGTPRRFLRYFPKVTEMVEL